MSDDVQNPDESSEMPADREADGLELGRPQSQTNENQGYISVKPRNSVHVPDSSFENYLFGKSGQDDCPAWSDSMKGRAAIRLVSRGIVGAAFFTMGGRIARMQMDGYNEHAMEWTIKRPFHKPLQAVAKGIDMTFGAGFKKLYKEAVKFGGASEAEAAEAAKTAMTFRDSRSFAVLDEHAKPIPLWVDEAKTIPRFETRGTKPQLDQAGRVRTNAQGHVMYGGEKVVYHLNSQGVAVPKQAVQKDPGRSYGAEVVSFTFDFAAASVGDAGTRNLFQVFDPNVKKTWLVNDDGKPAARGEHQHFVFSKWAKSTASTTWRVLSKNQGEDWAAAIPYAFQMKFQSKFLNNVFAGKRKDERNAWQGHDILFDQGWNGGAYRRTLNKQTGHMEITGDYQLPGAIDLHARFVGYNWYTLMFREGYDRIGNALAQWKDDGFAIHAPHLPQHFNPVTSTVDAVAQGGRYLTKSFIKANLYMNPAVVPFWFLRASQSKWRGGQFIEANADGQMRNMSETEIFKSRSRMEPGEVPFNAYAPSNYANYPTSNMGEKFEKGFSQTLNYVGAAQFKVGQKAGKVANMLAEKNLLPKSKWFGDLVQYGTSTSVYKDSLTRKNLMNKGRMNIMHEYTDAAISYTPYMFAKAETALRVDDSKGDGKPGQMDKAIYRFMDNVAAFNARGTWKSTKDMWKLATHFEQDIPSAETGARTAPKSIATQTFASTTTPTTMVSTGTMTHEPPTLSRHESDAKAADDSKSWAQSVMGNVNPAQIMSAGATRH